MVASMIIMFTLGGAVSTTRVPPSFAYLSDPGTVTQKPSYGAVAGYYNLILTDIGLGRYHNASQLLQTFRLVNVPPSVNQSALRANKDLEAVNGTIPRAFNNFDRAEKFIASRDLVNASLSVEAGCNFTRQASRNYSDFSGPVTSEFSSESVPVSRYSPGSELASATIRGLLARCEELSSLPNADLTITSPQSSIETGGKVSLGGALSLNGTGLGGQVVYFNIDGKYIGSLVTDASGSLSGTLDIPFIYKLHSTVQAIAPANDTSGLQGGRSNLLEFLIRFQGTSITLKDPPAFHPTEGFPVSGNLTSVGRPLPDAPVRVSFIKQSFDTFTDQEGRFGAFFTIPANTTDGTYLVRASFSPQGTYGPSFDVMSVAVDHIIVNLTLNSHQTFAGFPGELTGSATMNGTGVAGVNLMIQTPWGSFNTTTSGSGSYSVPVTSPALDFSFSEPVSVVVSPAQEFAGASASKAISLFNPLILVIVTIFTGFLGVGVLSYDPELLRVFSRHRQKPGAEQTISSTFGTISTDGEGIPELVALCMKAVAVVSKKFGRGFRPSLTLREVLAEVRQLAPGSDTDGFERILRATEDFLYSKSFDPSLLETSRKDLRDLEERWG